MKDGIKETSSRQRPKVHWVPWGRASLPYLLRILPLLLLGLGAFQAIANPTFLDPEPFLGYGWLGILFGVMGISAGLMLSEARTSHQAESARLTPPALAISAGILLLLPWFLWQEDGLTIALLILPISLAMGVGAFLLQNTRSKYLLTPGQKPRSETEVRCAVEIRTGRFIVIAVLIGIFLPTADLFYTHEHGYGTAEWRREYETGASTFSASGVFQASIAFAIALCVYAAHQGALSTNQRRLVGTLMLSLVIWFLAAPSIIQATGMQGSFRAPLSYLIAVLCAWASCEILRVPGVVRRGPGLGGKTV